MTKEVMGHGHHLRGDKAAGSLGRVSVEIGIGATQATECRLLADCSVRDSATFRELSGESGRTADIAKL